MAHLKSLWTAQGTFSVNSHSDYKKASKEVFDFLIKCKEQGIELRKEDEAFFITMITSKITNSLLESTCKLREKDS